MTDDLEQKPLILRKYSVIVSETVTVTYPSVTIEAESEVEAGDIAALMRADGMLGNPHEFESVEDVDYEISLDGTILR